MEKIVFKDFPNTTTPIDADNLNLLQSNVENDIDNLNTYSTTEHIVGTWIDGKPIYRKVITGIHNDGEVLISNVSSLITAYGQSDNGTGLLRNIPWIELYQNKNYTITVHLNSNNIILNSRLADVSAQTISSTALIIEYTKI